jgi:hypothetical protein
MRALRFAAVFTALTLSHSTPTSAATRPVDCTLTVDGRNYISGVCEFENDGGGSFSIYGEKYWAMVTDVEGGKGDAFWNETPYASHAQSRLGEVQRIGGCWVGARVRICARALGPAQRDAILALRPKGLGLSPEYMSDLCVSAPGYHFVAGAPLLLDHCDFQVGVRQRVFGLAENKVSIDGKPELCIDAKTQTDPNGTTLVLDDCAHVPTQWIYDGHEKTIRSNSGLCWALRDDNSVKNEPLPMIARPCEHDAEKNGRFVFGSD